MTKTYQSLHGSLHKVKYEAWQTFAVQNLNAACTQTKHKSKEEKNSDWNYIADVGKSTHYGMLSKLVKIS